MATLQSQHVFIIAIVMVTFLVISTSGVRIGTKYQVTSDDEETTTIVSKSMITTESEDLTTKLPRPISRPKKPSRRRGSSRRRSTSSTTLAPDTSTVSSSPTPPISTEASGSNLNSIQPDVIEAKTKINSENSEPTSIDPQLPLATTSASQLLDVASSPIDLQPTTEQSTLSTESKPKRKSTTSGSKRIKNKRPKPIADPIPIPLTEEPPIFPSTQNEISQEKWNIINSNNELGNKLLQAFEDLNGVEKKNILLSPISLFSTLLIVFSGSSSSTKNEMINLLLLKGMTQDQIDENFRSLMHDLLKLSGEKNILKSYSGIFVDKKVKVTPEFIHKIRTYYMGEFDNVDFVSDPVRIMDGINKDVYAQTNGAINQILEQPPDPLTKMILVNAFFFKGIWNRPFMPQFTTKMPFINADGSVNQVDTMFQTGPFMFNCDHEIHHACAAELLYSSGKLSFVAILPDNQTDFDGKSRMDLNMINDIIDGLSETILEFAMPRLSLEAQYDLLKPLEYLGMKAAFSPQSANFSQMSGSKELFVRQARHKTVLQIDEEGSRAAASTIAEIGTRRRAPQFILNRPFLFLIRDTRTNMILFMGKVNFIPPSSS